MDITKKIAQALSVNDAQVQAAVALLDDGSTVPFIARYRKEVTGGLDDTQLRELERQLVYLRELEDRRQTILKSIKDQEKLTPELEKAINATDNKSTLEDLYLPYKPKRRTKAQIAREAGLEPLATMLQQDPTNDPELTAATFINEEKSIPDTKAALEGARQILMEQFSENAELLGELRDYVWNNAIVNSTVMKDKETEGNKFADYFEYNEPIKKIPPHRSLAIFRGRKENILRLSLTLDDLQNQQCINRVAEQFDITDQRRAADQWLLETIEKTWRIKLTLSLELELMSHLKQAGENEAINVFADNLRHLLMAAPAGCRVTMGLDPGLRTGVKVVVVDQTGKLLDYAVIYPHVPRNDWDGALHTLGTLAIKHKVDLISIGNGTASRETDKLASELIKKLPDVKMTKIMVSEAGASVYSASELAAKEFPKLDVTFRGAVSIARRLQDPLSELVKIEPKSIGVGQYQHDVNQIKLARELKTVMEDCVNHVGVDVNTASVPLLASVAGLNETIAKNIVDYRDTNGLILDRKAIKKIPGLGAKKYLQAAGFMRINNGKNPLDASAVHPETYGIVEKILKDQSMNIKQLMGNTSVLRSLTVEKFTDDQFGVPTVKDIISELEKPGRDPRPEFTTAEFKEGINTIGDLKVSMILEGVVSNVANFGAFVDIGVHQDGLVHISQLANRFVSDAKEVVKVGDIVKVKVLGIDIDRNRINLTMKLDERSSAEQFSKAKTNHKPKLKNSAPKMNNAMSDALAAALNRD